MQAEVRGIEEKATFRLFSSSHLRCRGYGLERGGQCGFRGSFNRDRHGQTGTGLNMHGYFSDILYFLWLRMVTGVSVWPIILQTAQSAQAVLHHTLKPRPV